MMTIHKVNFMRSKIFELEFRFSLLHNSRFEHPTRQYDDTTRFGQTLSGDRVWPPDQNFVYGRQKNAVKPLEPSVSKYADFTRVY